MIDQPTLLTRPRDQAALRFVVWGLTLLLFNSVALAQEPKKAPNAGSQIVIQRPMGLPSNGPLRFCHLFAGKQSVPDVPLLP